MKINKRKFKCWFLAACLSSLIGAEITLLSPLLERPRRPYSTLYDLADDIPPLAYIEIPSDDGTIGVMSHSLDSGLVMIITDKNGLELTIRDEGANGFNTYPPRWWKIKNDNIYDESGNLIINRNPKFKGNIQRLYKKAVFEAIDYLSKK